MVDDSECYRSAGRGVRAVALALLLCLVSAFCWSAFEAHRGSATAYPQPFDSTSGSSGGDTGAGEKFYLPRQLFIETSRTVWRDPPVPEPVFAILLTIAFVTVQFLASAPVPLPAPVLATGIGTSNPRVPTGPPAAV